MATESVSRHGSWSSNWVFVMAAAGSAVGLGNIWKFPYITGENGGGAFVLVYLLCIVVIGVPIMIGEVFLGKLGRQSPINSLLELGKRFAVSRGWAVIGYLGVLTGFIILSFYAVISGWVLYYIYLHLTGEFVNATAAGTGDTFGALVSDPWIMIFWFTLFMGLTIVIVARGVNRGLEFAIRWLMPVLFVLLLVLVGYGIFAGSIGQSFRFLFDFNFASLSTNAVIIAMGHAFFTLSLGMGAIMAYGAYTPVDLPIKTTVITISVLDTVVALLAGLGIFSIVFANGLEPAAGPGLLFQSVPLAFGSLPGGIFFGTLFFVLVGIASVTSAISIIEPAVAYFVERYNKSRANVTCLLGVICWVLGLGTVLSFNLWSEYTVMGYTFFDVLDKLSQWVLLPLGGVLIALYVAFVIPREQVMSSLNLTEPWQEMAWTALVGYLAPAGVLIAVLYEFGAFDWLVGLFS